MYILLKNIIENAITHTPEQTAEGELGSIHVHIEQTPTPQIRITDSGSGIAPEQLQRITERFYRAEQKHDGFGIGLSIVQRICQLHQAQLSITNRTDGHSGLDVCITFNGVH